MDPLRTLTPGAPALKIGPVKISGGGRRAGLGFATGGLSELGGARGLEDLQARQLERQQHHASDTAQAEAEAARARAEEAERLAEQRAGRERIASRRRRGAGSTILAGGLGLTAPTPSGASLRTLLGA